MPHLCGTRSRLVTYLKRKRWRYVVLLDWPYGPNQPETLVGDAWGANASRQTVDTKMPRSDGPGLPFDLAFLNTGGLGSLFLALCTALGLTNRERMRSRTTFE